MRNYWEPKAKRGHRNEQKTQAELYDEIAAELEDHLPDCEWHHGRPFTDCKCLSPEGQARIARRLA